MATTPKKAAPKKKATGRVTKASQVKALTAEKMAEIAARRAEEAAVNLDS